MRKLRIKPVALPLCALTLAGACVGDPVPRFVLAGSVTGLSGSGLELTDGLGHTLAVKAGGWFTFPELVDLGAHVTVAVANQPVHPTQLCTLSASGDIEAVQAHVTDLQIACRTVDFPVGGSVAGLVGSGLVLQNAGCDDLAVHKDGPFAFPAVASGAAYDVTVKSEPLNPAQSCHVLRGGGTVDGSGVADIAITCTTRAFVIAGHLSGLTGSGLVLTNNGAEELALAADGAFAFTLPVLSGAPFTVAVAHQPHQPTQACAVVGGSGIVGSGDITTVAVNCSADSFLVGGSVSGLAGSGLVLVNGADQIAVNANGSFAFPSLVDNGAPFAVTIAAQPSAPAQTCSVHGGSGTVAGGNVTSVAIDCTTNEYSVGGAVSGLAGSGLTLQNNHGDTLPVSGNGPFTFVTSVPSAEAYAVSVATQPVGPSQTCSVSHASGVVDADDVSDVAVSCSTDDFLVGGVVVGLVGSGLALQESGGPELALGENGAFVFPAAVLSGADYSITIKTQPTGPSQTCVVSGGSGTVGASDALGAVVACSTDEFAVGGTIEGLAGAGLSLALNAGTPVPVSGNGSFAFPTVLASGAAYSVAIVSQPTSPWQTCSLAHASGTVTSGAVEDIAVTCTTNSYPVGGAVSGLAGSGLTLQNALGDDLAIATDGAFVFSALVPSGAPYAVTVKAQPSAPLQMCEVSSGGGLVAGGAVSDVAVTCATERFWLGGHVSGLVGTLVLENQGADTLIVDANGSFTFANQVLSGASYAVVVAAQPDAPAQTCSVTGGQGSMVGSDVLDIAITCSTNEYAVGGSVFGLVGSGLTLVRDGGEELAIASDGAFSFPTPVPSGSAFAVSVKTQPSDPTQTCSVTAGSGTVGASDVHSIAVNCSVNHYVLSGTVSGLAGEGLVLSDGAGHLLPVSGAGAFAFAEALPSGQSYAVSIAASPTNPWQSCSVSMAEGVIAASEVDEVLVTCTTNSYDVVVAVSGLAGEGLVLDNAGADALAVAGDGAHVFGAKVASGDAYDVGVLSQPTHPWQTCSLASHAGIVAGGAVNLALTCSTQSYRIRGTVSGLSGSNLVIENNLGDDLAVEVDGSFVLPTPVASGSAYAISVLTQPEDPWQTCVVTNATGTIAGADVSDLAITCTTDDYAVGGSVSGLFGSGLVLRNNGGDALAVAANGAFAFAQSLASGTAYAVTIGAQPENPWQTCAVSAGAGTVTASDVGDVQVSCTTHTHRIGGTVVGLAGSGLVLHQNGGDALSIGADGSFTFPTAVDSGASYLVTVASQPSSPWQTCSVSAGAGFVADADVSAVVVSCATDSYAIGGSVSGLAGSGLVLRDNGGDPLALSANGSFTFATPVASGAAYDVTVAVQPSSPCQVCTVTSGSGFVAGAAVNGVAVSCAACAATCDAPNALCGGVCTDVLNDVANCGSCGYDCAANQACVNGVCVGSGTLRVSAVWGRPGDLDLYLTTPNGHTIYYSNLGPSSGTDNGALDHDDTTGTGPENIFWDSAYSPPAGTYYVCADTYSFSAISGGNPVSYSVTVSMPNKSDQTFAGAWTFDTADPGGACSPSSQAYVGSFSYP